MNDLRFKTLQDAEPFLKDLPEGKANSIKLLIKWCDNFDVSTEGKIIWKFLKQ